MVRIFAAEAVSTENIVSSAEGGDVGAEDTVFRGNLSFRANDPLANSTFNIVALNT
jgi:hypothetical protein